MRRFVLLVAVFALALPCLAQLPQPQPTFTAGTSNTWNLDWEGLNGRTYFLQHSDDLVKWQYFPTIEIGYGYPTGYGFTSTGERFFVRLQFSDIPSSNPYYDDFDGDGISNWNEINSTQYYGRQASSINPSSGQTDPMNSDTDGDGVPDGAEGAEGTNPNDPASVPTFWWQRTTRSLQYDFDEYPPPNNKGTLSKTALWNAALNTNEMLTAAIPFPSLKERLEQLAFPTTLPATEGAGGLLPSEGQSSLIPNPPCFHATLNHQRLWLRRKQSDSQSHEKTVVLITERTIDGVEETKLIESKDLTIPANHTVSDFMDVSEGFNQSFTGNTSHTEVVKKTPVAVDIQRDEDVADGNWQPIAGKLAKALPGEKINLRIDTSKFPANVTVGSFEWVLPQKVFKDYVANNATGTLTQMAQADQTAADVHFYFADSGDKAITLKFKVDSTPIEATIQIKIEKPISTFTTEKGAVRLTAGHAGQHALGYFGVTTLPYGVRYVGSATTPQDWSQGTWSWVQLIKTRRDFTNPPNGNASHLGDGVTWKLDTEYPYGGVRTADGQLNRAIGDSPSEAADSLFRSTIKIVESFQTYLMFRPDGTDSRYVPLRKANWNWGGEGTAADNWAAVTNPVGDADAQGAEFNDHPQWNANTTEDVEN
jgi:hypothetical protein